VVWLIAKSTVVSREGVAEGGCVEYNKSDICVVVCSAV